MVSLSLTFSLNPTPALALGTVARWHGGTCNCNGGITALTTTGAFICFGIAINLSANGAADDESIAVDSLGNLAYNMAGLDTEVFSFLRVNPMMLFQTLQKGHVLVIPCKMLFGVGPPRVNKSFIHPWAHRGHFFQRGRPSS